MSRVVRNVCLSVDKCQGTGMEKMDHSFEMFVKMLACCQTPF